MKKRNKKVVITLEDEALFLQRTRPDKPVKDWEGRKKPVIKTENNTNEKGELLPKKSQVRIGADETLARPSGMPPFQCHLCGKEYTIWAKHKKICEEKAPPFFPCTICDELVDPFMYQDHMKMHPPLIKQKIIPPNRCNFCGDVDIDIMLHECEQLRAWSLGFWIEEQNEKRRRPVKSDENRPAKKIKAELKEMYEHVIKGKEV